ncbi:uncharacterized protein LOC101864422 isoform X1 [Aplysia californica]|uniref:Uncharacterized protein LOC101864422 isoform X1 n=1 Tax=Aplysia californica TaxID=6500 RepID=A0ABM1ABU5_APLCA|nr:uncharacterized protein LOC101864422 isoform X1 [Aplysia californica]
MAASEGSVKAEAPEDEIHNAKGSGCLNLCSMRNRVRSYIDKTMAPTPKGKKKAKHDVAVLETAIEAVRSKAMGLRKAAKHFGIAVSTLSDKVHGKSPIEYVPHSLLTQHEEERLVQWLLKMSKLGFGQTTDDIRVMAKAIMELSGGTTKDPSNLPSPAWVYRFLERHSELSLRTPMSLAKERALVTPPNVERWFHDLKTHVDALDPTLLCDPTRIFNADESGFSFDPKSRKVIAFKGAKTVYTALSANSKTQVTVLASVNAAGLYLPPLLIYPYKRIPGKNLLESFPESLLQVSDNGRITSAIFFTWLRDSFIPATEQIEKPLLLLVDGHVSHKALVEISKICEENKVILYCLLPHASHLVQPLDQAFFGSVKSAWSAASRRHMAETGNAVGLDSFAKVFQPVWQSCATKANAESSFRAAGIFPFSPERVLLTKKMLPSQVFRDFFSTGPVASSTSPPPVLAPPVAHSQLPDAIKDEPMPSSPFEPMPSSPFEPMPSSPFEPMPPSPFDPLAVSPVQDISNRPQSRGPTPPEPTCSGLQTSAPTPQQSAAREPESAYTVKQLEAMRNFTLFVVDDLGRNGFLRCHQALTRDTTENHEGFMQFKRLAANLKSSFEIPEVTTQSRAPLTSNDILRLPNFSGKGKKKMKKAAPRMQNVLSGAERREAIRLKESAREKQEKEKLARKTAREEEAGQSRENWERRLGREMTEVARQEKAAEMQGEWQEKKDQALLKKLERGAPKKRKRSDSDEDENVKGEVEQIMREADEEESVEDEYGESNDKCKGCAAKRHEADLLVACEVCDSWWHTSCTKSASNLTVEELEDFSFVCDKCCPNQ